MEFFCATTPQIPGLSIYNRQLEQTTHAPTGDRYHFGEDCAVIESGNTLYIAGNVEALEIQPGHQVFLFGNADEIHVHGGAKLTMFLTDETAEPSLIFVKEYPGLCVVQPGDNDLVMPPNVHQYLEVLDALLPDSELFVYEQMLVRGETHWITGPQSIGQS